MRTLVLGGLIFLFFYKPIIETKPRNQLDPVQILMNSLRPSSKGGKAR